MRLDGCYINLDRSHDRRRLMDAQLSGLGLAGLIRRLPAIDGLTGGPFDSRVKNGTWGCRRSHETAIGDAPPDSATVVLEDDVEISPHFPSIIQPDTIGHFVTHSPDVDIAFLDCCIYWNSAPVLLAKTESRMAHRAAADLDGHDRHQLVTVDVIDARDVYAYCAAAYLVTPAGKQTLRKLFAAAQDPATPVDTLFNGWIHSGELNARIFVPFLATPRLAAESTIGSEADSSVIDPNECFWAGVFRRIVFAGNPALDLARVEQVLGAARASSEYRLGMRVYEHFRSMT
ncbi:glycosyltransferase family 25 protein [Burkholderia alba]|uniref:glycosyltransferase family 25 protein n=1 Tax=Burkholderia alba TaxID=2683677 RepID=UPI002B0593BE|nr:hypothetical protein [Burkholderia alba]